MWDYQFHLPESCLEDTSPHVDIHHQDFIFTTCAHRSSSLSNKVSCRPQVNIDHFTKDVTLRNLVDLSPATFDLAQKRIFALMEKDSFGRFLRSEQYQELLVN